MEEVNNAKGATVALQQTAVVRKAVVLPPISPFSKRHSRATVELRVLRPRVFLGISGIAGGKLAAEIRGISLVAHINT